MLLLSFEPALSDGSARHKNIELDESVFSRIANGDAEALLELYEKTERAVFALALSVVKNPEDAADVAQETFIKIRSAAHLYVPMGKPMAWVFTIAKNLSLSLLRERGRRASGFSDTIENSERFSYVMDAEDKLALEAAMDVLGDEEREIILLHAVSGYRHREIADALCLPLSTVLSRYNRGLKKLQKRLSEKGMVL